MKLNVLCSKKKQPFCGTTDKHSTDTLRAVASSQMASVLWEFPTVVYFYNDIYSLTLT